MRTTGRKALNTVAPLAAPWPHPTVGFCFFLLQTQLIQHKEPPIREGCSISVILSRWMRQWQLWETLLTPVSANLAARLRWLHCFHFAFLCYVSRQKIKKRIWIWTPCLAYVLGRSVVNWAFIQIFSYRKPTAFYLMRVGAHTHVNRVTALHMLL